MKDSIALSRRFLRSVNLARDSRSDGGIGGYVVTPSAKTALFRISQGLAGLRTDRAFTLTGPYGTGKSSFALFLFHLLDRSSGEAWSLIRKADHALAKECRRVFWPTGKSKGYACFPATATMGESVPELLADAIDAFCGKAPSGVASLSRHLRSTCDSREVIQIVESISKAFRKAGFRGVLFLLDEFGRIFETARLRPDGMDAAILQDLAEVASRSADAGLALLGILHQGVEDYASSDPLLRREFRKIEGRFDPIAFSETAASQIQLIAAAIHSTAAIPKEDEHLLQSAIRLGVPAAVGLSAADFRHHVRSARPFHPIALAVLPDLFRRLGQNERSVFTYLAGHEPFGLQSLCSGSSRPARIRLDHIFDYLVTNFEPQLGAHSFGQAILAANAAIASKPSLSALDARILKSIAILSSLGTHCPLNATEEFVRFAIAPESADQRLEELLRQSILVFRRFNKTYALWNGSDIDLRESEKKADDELGKTGFSLAETLEKYVPPEPMVAKHHSFTTGTLRFFDTVYADDAAGLDDAAHTISATAAGALVVCLPERRQQIRAFIDSARRLSLDNPSLLFAVPRECGGLRDSLKEVRRLHWIEENERALRDDPIASREVSLRLAEATQGVIRRQFGLLDPNPSPHGVDCVFFRRGAQCENIRSNRDLSRLLSTICDELYPESPRIRNELVNRRTPSSQAASARNKLVTLLNDPATRKLWLLGIEGYPPERSIYESVILASGMHVEGENGEWRLVAPATDAPTNLRPAWDRLAEIVFAPREKPVTVKEIYEELRRPPYGMLDGLLPLLVIAFLLVERDEAFLYSEGTFQPEPTDAHFELLVRRPELFALSGMRIAGTRAAIVQRLAAGLNAESATVMPVVRKLYGLRNSLSKYALETDAVSDRAKAFRKAFEDAKSPEVLLFRALPAVFGLGDGIEEKSIDPRQLDHYFDGLNACIHELGGALPKLVSECRARLLKTFGLDATAEGWRTLYDRSCYLLARIGSSDLVPFLQNVKNTDGDWNKAVQVMSYVESSPMEKWGPLQIGEFERAVAGLAERFRAAWRPYDGTAALSSSEERAAVALLDAIHGVAKNGRASATVRRAALLRALAELDEKG